MWPGQALPAGTKDYYVTIYYNASQEDLAQGFAGRTFVQVQVDTTWTKGQIDLALQNAQIQRREQNNFAGLSSPRTGKSSP